MGMKRTILLLALITLLFACKKDGTRPVTGITATQNGTLLTLPTTFTGFKALATKDTLFITGTNNNANLVIALKQKGAGTYQLSEINAWFYNGEGDLVTAQYQLTSDPGNQVVITDYDETTHVLKGTFNLSFRNVNNVNNSVAIAVNLTNGTINVTLSDVYTDPFR
jgi:hypothetical protein